MHPIGVPTRRLADFRFRGTAFSPDKQHLQNPEQAHDVLQTYSHLFLPENLMTTPLQRQTFELLL